MKEPENFAVDFLGEWDGRVLRAARMKKKIEPKALRKTKRERTGDAFDKREQAAQRLYASFVRVEPCQPLVLLVAC